jgi:hypothetical protein
MKRLAWIAILGAALACSDNPTPGVLKVNLTTPNSGGDGAILLTVNGPGMLVSAAPGTGLRLFTQGLTMTSHVALTGTLRTGTILTIEVPDIGKASAYTATIQQVATPTYQLRTLTGYSLKVAP